MAYGIVHTKSYTSSAAQGIGREEDRKHLKERNPDIDPTRSHLNRTKFRDPHQTLYQAAKERLAKQGLELPKKKNQILFEQTVITASPEFFTANHVTKEALAHMRTPEEIDPVVKDWMQASEKWALDYFGADNVISMTWHLDETSPHMHVDHLPVVDGTFKNKVYARDETGKILRSETGSPVYARDENGKMIYEVRKGKKLSRDAYWRERGGRNSYRMMQQSYYEKVSRKFGLLRGEQSETTERIHIEQQRYKAEHAAIEAERNRFDASVSAAERDLAIRQAANAKEMWAVTAKEGSSPAAANEPDPLAGAKKTLSGDYKITKEQAAALRRKVQAADKMEQEQAAMQAKLNSLSDELITEQNRQLEYVRDKSYHSRESGRDYEEILFQASCWRNFKQVLQELPVSLSTAIFKLVKNIERRCRAYSQKHNQQM